MVLPLHRTGQITVGNALRLDWLEVCPPVSATLVEEVDLAGPTGRLALEENGLDEGGRVETYICGNPPYLGSRNQSDEHKSDLEPIMASRISSWKSLDYVSGWLVKAADYSVLVDTNFAFVTTNSLNQGLQVPLLWPTILGDGRCILFAYRSFKWSNLAANNAGVIVCIVGVGSATSSRPRIIFDDDTARAVRDVNPYLASAETVYIEGSRDSICDLPPMLFGNMPRDGGYLSLTHAEFRALERETQGASRFIYRYLGADEMINGLPRYCLWIGDDEVQCAMQYPEIASRLKCVSEMRAQSSAPSTRAYANRPHRFVQSPGVGKSSTLLVAGVSSERRNFLPVDFVGPRSVPSNLLFAIYDPPIWTLAVVASRLHITWVGAVCGKLKTDFRYSNTLGWNTFPVPKLTEQDKADLTRTAENILLAREVHFPATIADLYDPDAMPDDLRRAHDENDEVLERIYIGRRFRNDTERLEKLFEMYTRMTANQPTPKKGKKAA